MWSSPYRSFNRFISGVCSNPYQPRARINGSIVRCSGFIHNRLLQVFTTTCLGGTSAISILYSSFLASYCLSLIQKRGLPQMSQTANQGQQSQSVLSVSILSHSRSMSSTDTVGPSLRCCIVYPFHVGSVIVYTSLSHRTLLVKAIGAMIIDHRIWHVAGCRCIRHNRHNPGDPRRVNN